MKSEDRRCEVLCDKCVVLGYIKKFTRVGNFSKTKSNPVVSNLFNFYNKTPSAGRKSASLSTTVSPTCLYMHQRKSSIFGTVSAFCFISNLLFSCFPLGIKSLQYKE